VLNILLYLTICHGSGDSTIEREAFVLQEE